MFIHDSKYKDLAREELVKDIECLEGGDEVNSLNDEMELVIHATMLKHSIALTVRLQLLDAATREELEKRLQAAVSAKLKKEHANLYKGLFGSASDAKTRDSLLNVAIMGKGTINQWKQDIAQVRGGSKAASSQAGTANVIDEKYR